MRLLSVIFYQDGSYAGTQGHPAMLGATYQPPAYLAPGETALRPYLVTHLGAAEALEGAELDVSTELMHALGPHADSKPEALKFAIRDATRMPQLHDVPVVLSDFPAWVRRYGTARLPQFFRTFMLIRHPELAKEYRLHRGVAIAHVRELERKMGVHPDHSRAIKMEADAASSRWIRRNQLFAIARDKHRRRLIVDATK